MSTKSDLKRKMKDNDYTLDIIEADELIAVWRYRQANRFERSSNFSSVPKEWRYSAPLADKHECIPCHVSYGKNKFGSHSSIKPVNGTQGRTAFQIPDLTELDAVGFAKRNVAPYISPIMDSKTLFNVCKDLGIKGKVVTKIIDNRQYIILKGYAGYRNYLPGTIYTMNNRKIIQMAIGEMGIKNMVKRGARLTIYLTVPLSIFECILKDQRTMTQIIGHVYSDLIKIGISTLMTTLTVLAVGTVATYAAVPIIVAITIGLIVGGGLDVIDSKCGLTDKLVAAMEQVETLTKVGQYRGQRAQFIGQNMMSKMRF